MIKYIKSLRFKDEDGAVTVDWVVLTAAIVGLAAGAALTAIDGTTAAATTVSDGLAAKTVDVD